MQEGIEARPWGLCFRDSMELDSAILSELAQEVISLDPQETAWSHAVEMVFQDWRAGRREVSPDDIVNERVSTEHLDD